MPSVTVRPMTPSEFARMMAAAAEDYAARQIEAGLWPAEGALARATAETAKWLPDGIRTPRTLLLRGVDAHGVGVGSAWVALDDPNGRPDTAFLFELLVDPSRRGCGYGRALLAAVEEATRAAGAPALALNVFGANRVAIALYASAGYGVTAQQMRKAI
ncbi:GNAT family N-acetyltransferase [Clavibacter michiganensis]|uniref:GNAT family N-acetyltransferase n=1 Tax=Clavibacter michiganensis TaxID=28447 RepID=UPI001365BACF|nr:GNAT family N-acetyltransferase [Clavibacter michiganensis]MWJ12932.1 N-acetyltransferase [Clavibacter michiganensis subsp. michiganensis]MWJ47845.1 N-acetyltransferase [Clavibacter michiganensis subsp. michiganensis]